MDACASKLLDERTPNPAFETDAVQRGALHGAAQRKRLNR
jgi:hypothetical protein